ncbi:hypothetical protein AAVH_21843 [Aphelenchoides avenae]|nr:hypothetical protein AAVH_21843 [Aphelenchus avenae]
MGNVWTSVKDTVTGWFLSIVFWILEKIICWTVIDCKKWTLDLKNVAINRTIPVPLDEANMTKKVDGIAYNITELSAYGRNASAAIREAAHFGRELPEAIHLDVRICSTDRWVDSQKYVFVPLVLAAMTVLLFVVGYRYWQSYYGLKGTRSELRRIVQLREFERLGATPSGVPDAFVHKILNDIGVRKPIVSLP